MSKFIFILTMLGLLLLSFTILFSKTISQYILNSEEYSFLLIIISFAFPFVAISSIFDASFRGLKKFEKFVKISVFISFTTLLLSITLVWLLGLEGVALALLLSSFLQTIIYFIYFKKEKLFTFKDLIISNISLSEPLKLILKIGFAGLTDLFFIQLTLIFIRSLIIRNFGLESNGIYQSIFTISNNYLNLFFMTVGIYILPVLSEIKDIPKMNEEINNIYKLTLYFIFPTILLTFVFRQYIILIFFTSKFNLASNFFIYNFIGDYFKALSWVLGSWLIPRSKVKLWLTLAMIYNILYNLIFLILINSFFKDLRSVVIAYAFVNIFHFLINFYFIRKLNFFRFKRENIKIMFLSTMLLFIVLIISNLNIFIGYIIVFPAMVIWLVLCVKKNEVYAFLKLIKLKYSIKLN